MSSAHPDIAKDATSTLESGFGNVGMYSAKHVHRAVAKRKRGERCEKSSAHPDIAKDATSTLESEESTAKE